MYGKKADEFVHTFIHITVEPGKRRKILPYPRLLIRGFSEQALGDNKFNVSAGDQDLFKTVAHPPDAVCNKSKPGAVEYGFLHAGHEPEAKILADLADFAQKAEIQDQFLVFSGSKKVQKLIHNQQEPLVWINLAEFFHHVFECTFIAGNC